MSIHEIKKKIKECRNCALYTSGAGVPGEGEPCELMIVGEAPGAEEQTSGRPFVGRAGKLLRRLLEDEGISRFYITNVVKHRPPNNRRPLDTEIAACREHLEAEISAVKPRVIIALGSTAINYFTGEKQVGGTRVLRAGDVNYVLTYHPAAALRNPALKQDISNAIRIAKSLLKDSDRQKQP